MPDRNGRALLGWVAPGDVERLYRSANISSPGTLDEFRDACNAERQARPAGTPIAVGAAGPAELPATVADLSAALIESSLFKRAYAQNAIGIRSVSLAMLVSPQWWVDDDYVSDLGEAIPEHGDDVAQFEFCFGRGRVELPVAQGPGPNRGYLVAFSSPTRNLDAPGELPEVLRVSDHCVEVKVRVETRPNHIMVGPIQGTDRLLILNGVHRLFALLQAGFARAFCVLTQPVNLAQPFQGLDFSNDPQLFKPAELHSAQPPWLRHYAVHSHPVAIRALVQTLRLAIVPDIGFVPKL